MARPLRVSPDRILAAAAAEFAACGFAGARVDRIARRARVNKAMLYYHFQSKQALYRHLLRQTFAEAAARLQAIGAGPGPAPDRVDRAILAFAAFMRDHPFFPAIMLREVAEGGAHLDRGTLAALAGVPRAFFGLLRDGVRRGELRAVHPMVAYFSALAPIVFFLAAAPIRQELGETQLAQLRNLTPDEFVGQVQAFVRLALAPQAPNVRRTQKRRTP